ncbi:MAG: hypothetical protein ABIB47_01025 [Candidatus Woesearchaeota archaeon]
MGIEKITCDIFGANVETLFEALISGDVDLHVEDNGRLVPRAFAHKEGCRDCGLLFGGYLAENAGRFKDVGLATNYGTNVERIKKYIQSQN